MATHAIGKLKFNMSGDGIAFRWGDGEVHRLFHGKKAGTDENADNYEYGDKGYVEDPGYQDDYEAREDDYAEDDYDERDYDDRDYDDGGYDDGYEDRDYDDGYDDREYDGDGYDDDGYDDGGYDDDGYADDGYYDEGDYDDRYSDEDAGEYYDDESPLMQYVDRNDWVTYLLLFLFPPLGIYLLWRRNRFEKPIRWAISIVSAIWFIVALALIFSALFGGSGDRSVPPSITIPPVEATAKPTAEPASTDAADSADTSDGSGSGAASTEPSPTPLTGSAGASGSTDAGQYVYSPQSGLYYHSIETCTNIDEEAKGSLSRIPVDVAKNTRRQSACPVCIGGGTATTYYATRGGSYYHVDSTCSSMRNPLEYTKEAAEQAGKSPCPVCILKTQKSLDEKEEAENTQFITDSTTDRSNIQVYATKGGTYFHIKEDCSGMTGASKGPLLLALRAGKKACPTCCPTAGTLVYCTAGGKSYHLDSACQGMKNAKQVTLAEALVLGKTKCDICVKKNLTGSLSSATGTTGTSAKSDTKANTVSLTSAAGTTYVYGTAGGTYYHTNSTCSGMKDAQRYRLSEMLAQGRKACPVCASSADTKVYASPGGSYYHSYATCSGMTNASSGTLAQALAKGYKRCPKCWSSTNNAGTTTTASTGGNAASKSSSSSGTAASASRASATASNTYVYASREGSYYHLDSTCSGMKNASRITLKTAINAGKKPCPTCASSASRIVYSTSNGKNYHIASSCEASGMKGGTRRTLAEALMMNQTACPYCIIGRNTGTAATGQTAKTTAAQALAIDVDTGEVKRVTNTYSSGTSGVKVYAALDNPYFHTKSSCGSMTNGSRVALETALNYGKKPCPKCASSAGRTVYATRGGKYYHYSKSDAGSGAKAGTLASALAYGFSPCPTCVLKTSSKTGNGSGLYKTGTSGIKVYATPKGPYYHAKSNCSGMTGASRVALETALNYGKKACPVCLKIASRKVYSSRGDKYFHGYKAHAGSGATAGTLADALAYGLRICPTCAAYATRAGDSIVTDLGIDNGIGSDNGGSKDAPVSTVKYAASGSTGVYIHIDSANNYYHKAATCSEAGFSGGTKVTLEYVKDWGYKACPYCSPPTSILPEES